MREVVSTVLLIALTILLCSITISYFLWFSRTLVTRLDFEVFDLKVYSSRTVVVISNTGTVVIDKVEVRVDNTVIGCADVHIARGELKKVVIPHSIELKPGSSVTIAIIAYSNELSKGHVARVVVLP
ncbi:MAG: hypothetical protein DRJ40_10830 [Thermoprotei archaeon]|nr:MAG: hypothetical protein DRJ40_10830 [Thermoprotei archaeon]